MDFLAPHRVDQGSVNTSIHDLLHATKTFADSVMPEDPFAGGFAEISLITARRP
jgi:hypothetical protein